MLLLLMRRLCFACHAEQQELCYGAVTESPAQAAEKNKHDSPT